MGSFDFSAAKRLVRDKRNLAPGGSIASGVVELFKEYMSSLPFIASIPFGWLAAVLGALWLGYDVVHKDGRVRKKWRQLRSIGEFGKLMISSAPFDPGQDYGGEQIYLTVSIPFRAPKNIRVDVVMVKVVSYNYNGKLSEPPHGEYTWRPFQWKYLVKDEVVNIELFHLPANETDPGYCGDRKNGSQYFGAGYGQIITITIAADKRTQEKKFLTLMPSRMGVWGHESDFSLGSRMLIFDESNDAVFDELILAEGERRKFIPGLGFHSY